MIGITIKPTIGIGDALQFSSLPENYFKATGEKLIDMSKPWFFDHNPYVIRDVDLKPRKTIEMWNYSPKQYEFPTPRPNRPGVYLSNAEIWASVLEVPCTLNRPRLYRYEHYPYKDRQNILLHTNGVSHGEMPEHIVEHVIRKYGHTGKLYHVGPVNPKQKDYGLPRIQTATLWEFAQLVSTARLFIGVDSGPGWIANCYPDVVVKKVRVKPNPPEQFKDWIPLEIKNIHSHWDDRCHQVYNVSENDIGFTYGYPRI